LTNEECRKYATILYIVEVMTEYYHELNSRK